MPCERISPRSSISRKRRIRRLPADAHPSRIDSPSGRALLSAPLSPPSAIGDRPVTLQGAKPSRSSTCCSDARRAGANHRPCRLRRLPGKAIAAGAFDVRRLSVYPRESIRPPARPPEEVPGPPARTGRRIHPSLAARASAARSCVSSPPVGGAPALDDDIIAAMRRIRGARRGGARPRGRTFHQTDARRSAGGSARF